MCTLVVAAVVVSVAVVGACYAPELRDCTVSCASSSDCSGGQICGGAHLCAAPEVAGQCAVSLPMDAAPLDARADTRDARRDASARDAAPRPDAPRIDAAPPDAARSVILHLHVDGSGEITTAAGATCNGQGPQHGDCLIEVLEGVAITLDATGEGGQVFQQWTGQACSGGDAVCVLTPVMPITDIHARFAPG
jgi:hypothetical protein